MTENQSEREYLRAAEAAAYLKVSPKTVSRWAKEGKIPHIVTLGGHRRFPREEIMRLARQLGVAGPVEPGEVELETQEAAAEVESAD